MQICIHHFMVTINTRKLNTNGWKFDNSSSDSKNSIDCMICKHYKRCVQKHAQKKESRCYIDQTVPFSMKFVDFYMISNDFPSFIGFHRILLISYHSIQLSLRLKTTTGRKPKKFIGGWEIMWTWIEYDYYML